MDEQNIKELVLHKRSKTLELVLGNGAHHILTAEFLRVHSPSAEVKGHGNPILVIGKKHVGIDKIAPVGHYGIRIDFDDDHNTGLYTWVYLNKLATEHDALWAKYNQALDSAQLSNDPNETAVRWVPPPN